VQLTASTRLELDREPRVRTFQGAAPMGSHPFFWGGFMLIDSGAPVPPVAVPEAARPNVDLLR